jgi:hypothetical protein
MTQLDLIPTPPPAPPKRPGYRIVETYRGYDIATDPSLRFGGLFLVFDPAGTMIAQAQVSQWSARRLIEAERVAEGMRGDD